VKEISENRQIHFHRREDWERKRDENFTNILLLSTFSFETSFFRNIKEQPCKNRVALLSYDELKEMNDLTIIG